MGKHNTVKKGKQRLEPVAPGPAIAPPPPSSPPPPMVVSPPSAHHIQHPSGPIDTVEEQDEVGGLPGVPVGGTEDESWQNVSHSADGWMADMPGNSNDDLDVDGWETGVIQSPMPPLPPQSAQKKTGGGRDHTKLHHPQQQFPFPSPSHQGSGFGASAGHHKSSIANSRGHAKLQRPSQDTWIPKDDEWSDDDGWDDQEDGNEYDGWNSGNSGWGQQPHSAAWAHAVSAHSVRSRSTSHVPASGWQSWGEEAQRLAKVTFDPAIPSSPNSIGSRTVLSQLEQSQILSELLNNPQQNPQPYHVPPTATNGWQHQPSQTGQRHPQQQHEPRRSFVQHYRQESKKNTKGGLPIPHPQKENGRQQEDVHDVWGLGDGWRDLHDEEEQDLTPDAWGRRVHFSSSAVRASMLPSSAHSVAPSAVVENFTVNALPQNKLGLSTIPMSKTLSYAYSGTTPSTESEPGRAAMQRITDFHFVESRGEALKSVQRAFFDKQRKASDRFYWLFSPEKDERVSSLLNWINSMSFGIASFGLQKFLQTRERGALIVNAAYRPVHSPSEPAFDWVTWNQIQRTMDRILQESVGYYNPAMHIIVFVFLPSPSGNSVAIWRRRLSIPNNIRLSYQAQITQAMTSLRKDYPVHVDELPPPPTPKPTPPPPKKKRKWYKLWLSS